MQNNQHTPTAGTLCEAPLHQSQQITRARYAVSLRTTLFILTVLLVAFALRMHNLNGDSIWHDEGWSIRAMRGPFTTPDDNTPYLYYVTGHLLWKAGAGESSLAFRTVSVLIGVLTVALAIRIGQRWYGTSAGLAAGVLVAVSPLLWEYSQEVRAYIAVPLIALAMLAGAEAILRHQPGHSIPHKLWAYVFVVELAGLYTHNLSVPLIVWLNTALGFSWLWRRDWPHLRTWAGLQIVLVISYIPWLLTQSPSGTPLNTPPHPGLALVRDIWASYFLPVLVQLQETQNGRDLLTPLTLFGVVVVGIVIIRLILSRRETAQNLPDTPHLLRLWLLISHAILVPAFSTMLMLAAHIDFHPRYYIAAVPGTVLLLVAPVMGNGYPTKHTQARVLMLVLFPAVLFSAMSIHQINTTRAYQHDDFAGLAAYYATLPDDAIILVPFDIERALQDYYADVLAIRAQFVNIPLYSDEETVLATLSQLAGQSPRHVEFLTWFQLPADVRGMYPCLLTALSTRVGEAQTYYGLMTQAFTLRPGVAFTTIDTTPRYNEIALLDMGYWASENGVCLRTNWQPKQQQTENISVAAAILNPFGDEIARTDNEITQPDNVGTKHWEDGETGQTYHLLTLPPGAPLMDYTLTLNIYTPSSPSGFDRLDANDSPAGKTLLLNAAVSAQGQPAQFTQTALLADNVNDNIKTGQPLNITLALTTPNQSSVTLTGDNWQLAQPATGSRKGLLSWHQFIIPTGNSGEATLAVDGVALAQYTVIDTPHIYTMPDFDSPVGVNFPGVGTLIGLSLNTTPVSGAPISAENPPEVTLVWQAVLPEHIKIPYTVFVQLITKDGRVLAQSDSPPAGGTRPTNSWLNGEYIVDMHTLHFNITEYEGNAILIAGLYDAADNFRRVLTSDGVDHAQIGPPVTIKIP